jgi:hypothetical protein
MNRLFKILDGINSDGGNADANLADLDAICSYADACGEDITKVEAQRIAVVGIKWRDEQKNGNGEWSRMRHEAMDALED